MQTDSLPNESSVAIVDFQELTFSSARTIDAAVVARQFAATFNALTDVERQDLSFGDMTPNTDNEADLLVTTNFDPTYLALMDIRPADDLYAAASRVRIASHGYARWLGKAIEERSDRYPRGLQHPLFLLLVASDWAFLPSETAEKVLQSLLVKRRWAFDAIFLYTPGSDENAQAKFVYPISHKQRRGFDPDRVVGHSYDNVKPGSATA